MLQDVVEVRLLRDGILVDGNPLSNLPEVENGGRARICSPRVVGFRKRTDFTAEREKFKIRVLDDGCGVAIQQENENGQRNLSFGHVPYDKPLVLGNEPLLEINCQGYIYSPEILDLMDKQKKLQRGAAAEDFGRGGDGLARAILFMTPPVEVETQGFASPEDPWDRSAKPELADLSLMTEFRFSPGSKRVDKAGHKKMFFSFGAVSVADLDDILRVHRQGFFEVAAKFPQDLRRVFSLAHRLAKVHNFASAYFQNRKKFGKVGEQFPLRLVDDLSRYATDNFAKDLEPAHYIMEKYGIDLSILDPYDQQEERERILREMVRLIQVPGLPLR